MYVAWWRLVWQNRRSYLTPSQRNSQSVSITWKARNIFILNFFSDRRELHFRLAGNCRNFQNRNHNTWQESCKTFAMFWIRFLLHFLENLFAKRFVFAGISVVDLARFRFLCIVAEFVAIIGWSGAGVALSIVIFTMGANRKGAAGVRSLVLGLKKE